MTYKSFYILIIAVITLSACEKDITLDSTQAAPKIVIEGLVTNQSYRQFIKVSRSADFYSTGKTPRVTDATVYIKDDIGNHIDFIHNPNSNEDSVGYYKPVDGFAGEIGRTYFMTVIADGVTYSAQDKLFAVTPIDSLTYEKNDKEAEDPEVPGRFYEVLMYAKEPGETKDYYKFDFYRNDSLTTDTETDIYFSDDVVLGEEINGVASPIYYELGDKAGFEMFSLSRAGYVFYSDLYNLINIDGGMYGPPPANSRTNLNNGALGFFQVSALEKKDIVLE
jgi:hypothetical protein